MIFDSHLENKLSIPSNLGIPRWNKRIVYYIFKIRYLQLYQENFSGFPNYPIRQIIQENYFNEHENKYIYIYIVYYKLYNNYSF